MPLVKVRYSDAVAVPTLDGLGPLLCARVALRLSCSDAGGQLTANDIEVQFDPASKYDAMAHDLMIDVEAMDFPARKDDFGSRVRRLREDLESAVPVGYRFGLWVKLVDAQWEEGESTGRPLANFQSGM